MTTDTKQVTVEEKLQRLDATEERIHATNHDEKASERNERHLAQVKRQREILTAVLDAHGNITLPTPRDVAYADVSHLFDDDERMAILWQYRRHLSLGSFTEAIIEAADVADDANLDKLAKGFPALVSGIRRWRNERGWADEVRTLLADG
jgi:hypothetical protein